MNKTINGVEVKVYKLGLPPYQDRKFKELLDTLANSLTEGCRVTVFGPDAETIGKEVTIDLEENGSFGFTGEAPDDIYVGPARKWANMVGCIYDLQAFLPSGCRIIVKGRLYARE